MQSKTSIFLITVLSFAVLAFVGCSDDDDDNGTNSTAFPAELVGEYVQTSVTLNGTPQDVATFYEWDATAVRSLITISASGEQLYQEFDANDSVLYYDSGPATISGTSLTITVSSENGTPVTPYTTFSGTWDLTGNILTLTMVEGTNTAVLVMTKQ
ncbi:MAG: hypothetical protein J7J98_05410 [candidate division Zixibacteria bacterium]|nr:hypothetical protein [candidate division Zixibacteria bacterium]